ncbi:MAG: bifunctional phosphopantothenoylcysteine decarboxylase/phosphopantothenate--cysteine ligase CoaBC [Nitrospirae bacterium CG_4_8_14_3_um_filter_70_85]|nr:MAG: bifunctional phosphopantothenoylcysteine decarboxylase/phosphopantothenate--cysteine ligase CoaBC [Nitrospirae bacterium CG_4_8_14_3_um_filter_70_85]PIX83430.1 MAG: bifunctional phosphopantothenoylcysteine decarboxylase/phosphopantothenate--cysteine ligase CoaBC [Nitrospirae bacterium CG_4_10_14_3_um_filter_70_108]
MERRMGLDPGGDPPPHPPLHGRAGQRPTASWGAMSGGVHPEGDPVGGGRLVGVRCLLVVTGSIAAYKAVFLLRQLQGEGAVVRVAMSAAATRFVAPLTFASLTGAPVITEATPPVEGEIPHVAGGREAEVVIVCPATANTLAKLAHGLADNVVSALLLAAPTRLLLAPAMNPRMWDHPATRRNVALLEQDGHRIVPPEVGAMACGEVGEGRLAEGARIVGAVVDLLGGRPLAGRRLLVSAGATREHLDAVRFLSNPATGRMGFALAAAGRELGAEVIVVHGPTEVAPPAGVATVGVVSAAEMLAALEQYVAGCDLLVMAAAVGDLRFPHRLPGKLPKGELPAALAVEETPDLLAALAAHKRPGQLFIGFAAESGDVEGHALAKLKRKGMDLVVANDITAPGIGFASPDNAATLLDGQGGRWEFPRTDKRTLARQILLQAARLLG